MVTTGLSVRYLGGTSGSTPVKLPDLKEFSPGPTWPNIFSDFHDRDQISNREQYKTNRNAENAMYDYSSEYLRICFQLYEDSSRPSLNILRTLCERSKKA